jgi:hypothetical protein
LEEYISLLVDATVKSGIKRQIEAFRSGFNQVQRLWHCSKIFIVVSLVILTLIKANSMVLVYFRFLTSHPSKYFHRKN